MLDDVFVSLDDSMTALSYRDLIRVLYVAITCGADF